MGSETANVTRLIVAICNSGCLFELEESLMDGEMTRDLVPVFDEIVDLLCKVAKVFMGTTAALSLDLYNMSVAVAHTILRDSHSLANARETSLIFACMASFSVI